MIATRYLSRTGIMVGLLLLAITSGMAAIQVEVDGSPLYLSVQPTLESGRTMVPLRGIFESLGAQVNWDAYSRTITATKGDTDVRLAIGDPRATVNGRVVQLDAPAMILGGSTMVPLRFVSEALGADVKWFEATQTVSITTGQDPIAEVPSQVVQPATQSVIIPEGTVIPVSLDKALSSETNRQGDPITVTVRSAYDGDAEFPRGTKISGVVSEAQMASSGQPGMLNLAFHQVVLPDGHRISTDGSLVSLDEKTVKQTSDGRLVVRNKSNNDQLKFIGIGAVGGFILGKLTDHTLEGTILGAAAGYLYSENNKKKIQPTDVSVAEGTEFGVQLNRQLAYNPSRAFVVAREDYLNAQPSSVSPSPQNIQVTAGGRAITFANAAQPVDEDGIVLVPLAPVMDQANISYKYDEHLQAISLDTDQGALQMNIGKSYALLNGEREALEAPAQVRDGVVFVPLHFLALATGTRVVWVAENRTVTMYNPS
jgi:hypothetical protein